MIRLNSGNLGPQKTDLDVFIIISNEVFGKCVFNYWQMKLRGYSCVVVVDLIINTKGNIIKEMW